MTLQGIKNFASKKHVIKLLENVVSVEAVDFPSLRFFIHIGNHAVFVLHVM